MMGPTEAFGFARSWLIYRGPTWRRRAMRTLYRRYVNPGDLCFDIGAHVGNRVSVFRALGARVVAVEPHPRFARYLECSIADDAVKVVRAAVADREGKALLRVDPRNPTVATISESFQEAVHGEPGWSSVRWEQTHEVHVTTLPALIAHYGAPAFCKIDVEGAELEVIQALSAPLPALSFEVLPATRERALAAIAHLECLGRYRYNFSASETMRMRFERDRDAQVMRDFLCRLRPTDPSGDVYACLASND